MIRIGMLTSPSRLLHDLKHRTTDALARHVLLRSPTLETAFIRLSRSFPSVRPIQWLCFSLSREIAKTPDPSRIARLPSGALMELDVSDVFGQVYYFGKVYEPQVTEIILQHLKPGDTAIDIGANAGYFTLLMADAVGLSGTVHAFEPNDDLVETLLRSIRLNGFESRVIVNRTAVAAASQSDVPFRVAGKGNTGASALSMVEEQGRSRNELLIRVRPVTTVSLDDYVRTVGLSTCTLMKIDVEGAEDLVMQGMTNVLRTVKPEVIICETRIGSTAHTILMQAGYVVQLVVDWQPETTREGYSLVGNVIYAIGADHGA